jgi:UDP-2,3-diacylglucosamine pyrophosphatase LpxH
MQQDDGHAIIVVSDFHLAGGYDANTGRFARHESFFHDAAFARFLDDLRHRAAAENRQWRLVVLGDLLDFLRVDAGFSGEIGGHPDTSERATLAKLERIAAGHPEFFSALARFVAAGFPLDIVPGNHDIELMRGSTQQRLKELIARFGGRTETMATVAFHPWIYYVPGVLYAEHGHQYHDINALAMLLRPYSTRDSGRIDLPLGSHLEAYLLDIVEAIDPVAKGVTTPSRQLLRAIRARPILALRTLPHHARLVGTILGDVRNRSSAEWTARRAAYQEEVLRPYAAEVGLGYETLAEIDQLSAVSALSLTSRILRKSIFQLLGRHLSSRPPKRPSSYLHRASLAIHGLLEAERKDVPFYVFGHAHTADRIPLVAHAATPCYLNAGSWTTAGPLATNSTGSQDRFPFVQITHERGAPAPVAHLLLWNDAAGRHEPLSLSGP